MCNDWAYSKYYYSGWTSEEMEKRAATLNENHATEALQYITKLKNSSQSFEQFDTQAVQLAIGVVTVPRSHPKYKLNYLTQVFAMLHKNIRKDTKHFENKVLFLCDTFPGPGDHTEVKTLETLVQVYHRFPQNNATAVTMNRFEREKQDYSYCLDVALTYNPKYVLIVEDDALAKEDVFEILHFVLTNLVEKKYSGGDHSRNREEWASLKLFYPERWQGYAFEAVPLLELLATGATGGAFFVFIGRSCKRRETKCGHLVINYLVGSVYFILLAFMVGRPYILEWKRLSKFTHTVVPAPECCSPAILYTSQKAKELSHYLKNVTCQSSFPVDFAMDKFTKTRNYKKYLIVPNLMQHIGMYSSIKTKSKFPQTFLYRK